MKLKMNFKAIHLRVTFIALDGPRSVFLSLVQCEELLQWICTLALIARPAPVTQDRLRRFIFRINFTLYS